MKTHQQRIKEYVEKHKIAILFEELMSRLIVDLPPDPIPFLIRMLQTKLEITKPQTVINVSSLRRSTGDLSTVLSVPKTKSQLKPSSASSVRNRNFSSRVIGVRTGESPARKPNRIRSATIPFSYKGPALVQGSAGDKRSKEFEEASDRLLYSRSHWKSRALRQPSPVSLPKNPDVSSHRKYDSSPNEIPVQETKTVNKKEVSRNCSPSDLKKLRWHSDKEYTKQLINHKSRLVEAKTNDSAENDSSVYGSDADSQEDAIELSELANDLLEESIIDTKSYQNNQRSKSVSPYEYAYCPRCSFLVSLKDSPTKVIFVKDSSKFVASSKPVVMQRPAVRIHSPKSICSDEIPTNVVYGTSAKLPLWQTEESAEKDYNPVPTSYKTPGVEKYSPIHLSRASLTEDLFRSSTSRRTSPITVLSPSVEPTIVSRETVLTPTGDDDGEQFKAYHLSTKPTSWRPYDGSDEEVDSIRGYAVRVRE